MVTLCGDCGTHTSYYLIGVVVGRNEGVVCHPACAVRWRCSILFRHIRLERGVRAIGSIWWKVSGILLLLDLI